MNFLIFTIMLIIIIFDGLPLIKNRHWKEFLIICSFLSLGVVLITLYAYNVKSPLMSLYELIKPPLAPIIKKGS